MLSLRVGAFGWVAIDTCLVFLLVCGDRVSCLSVC